jgi:hypothetical protein
VLPTGSVPVPLKMLPATVRLVSVLPLAAVADTKVSVPRPVGSVSVMRAPVTALGPAIAKVSVNVVVWPTTSDGVLATLVEPGRRWGRSRPSAAHVVGQVGVAGIGCCVDRRVVDRRAVGAATARNTIVRVWLTGMVTVPVKVVPLLMLADVSVVAPLDPAALTKAERAQPGGQRIDHRGGSGLLRPGIAHGQVNRVVCPMDKVLVLAALVMDRSVSGRHL